MRIHTLLLQSTLWYCWNLETMLSGIISSCKSGGRIVKVLRVWILKDDGGACRSLVALLRPAPKKTRWQKRLLRGGWNDQQMMSSVGLWQIFSCPKRWRCLLHVKCWEITSWTELVPHSNVVNWASSICHMLLLQYFFSLVWASNVTALYIGPKVNHWKEATWDITNYRSKCISLKSYCI
jgi:hypothetical protein